MSTIPLRYRFQEWLADKTGWVQYPRQMHIPRQPIERLRFKYQMPLLQRIAILQLSILGLFIGLFFLGCGIFLCYVIVASLFS
ncbi:hypothetical protein HNQ50_000315 [Silvimonas terrae]|uniref:Uncharacterized protein n=1 Tax=Silvimonas terrae TaxID=300266 RepID=A0A840R8G0_9NEIS|nr:hypothetical protein [Silvimonas terrae]MBB5189605.1 hypothetical protein [Silvimonas terrae]